MSSQLTLAELRAWDRPGPRYTSYPTVPIWEEIPDQVTRDALRAVGAPAQVYVHVPFCAEQCWFCGCNQVVAGRRSIGDRYLDALERQIDELPLPPGRLPVSRIHLGGGTPTWLDTAQLRRLHEMVMRRFEPIEGAELSVEADPQVTTHEQLKVLGELGFCRLSLGVQSFDDEVLTAVNRPQWGERIGELLGTARSLGWWGLNLDLMYGLPKQSLESFRDTVQRSLDLRPDRLAVFGYAHVPWIRRHQRNISEDDLPGVEVRAQQYLLAQQMFKDAGYVAIGLDHFALPDDELAVAARERSLHRNFMGYATGMRPDLIGLGVSAISEVAGVYWQDEPKLGAWLRKVEAGEPLAERGWVLSDEDKRRRDIIEGVMCNLEVRDPKLLETYPEAADKLAELQAAGLVELNEEGLQVPERGRVLLRLPAMAFDAYLKKGGRFSRAI